MKNQSLSKVFEAKFEGDVFEIVMQTSTKYHWRQTSGEETVAKGETVMLSEAIDAVFKQISSWSLDIDTGSVKAGGI